MNLIKMIVVPQDAKKPGELWQLLMGLKACELKNDALLDVFYEYVSEHYPSDSN